MDIIWINGRFLGRNITGVERVACEILKSLKKHFLHADGSIDIHGCQYQLKIAIPLHADTSQHQALLEGFQVERFGSAQGHLWEQVHLATRTRGQWLINLCNTAPLFKRKQLVFIHDAQVYAIPNNFSKSFIYWYKLSANLLTRNASVLVTNSRFSKQELIRYVGPQCHKFAVLHLGADHMQQFLEAEPNEILLQQLPSTPFLLAVSSQNPNKNFQLIVNALETLGNSAPPCVIVGQRYDAVFKQAQLQSNQVIHLGYVDDATLAALYRRALCLIFPSKYEGFGLPPIEAMWCGCSVIGSQIPALEEVCQEYILYCDPSSKESLAAQIQRLNNDTFAGLKTAGLEHAHQYTWIKTTQHLLSSLAKKMAQPVRSNTHESRNYS